MVSKGGIFGIWYDPDHLNYYGGIEPIISNNKLISIKFKLNASGDTVEQQKQQIINRAVAMGWNAGLLTDPSVVSFELDAPNDQLIISVSTAHSDSYDTCFAIASVICYFLTDGDFTMEKGGIFLLNMWEALNNWTNHTGMPFALQKASAGAFHEVVDEPGYSGDPEHMYLKFRFDVLEQEIASLSGLSITTAHSAGGMVSVVDTGAGASFDQAGTYAQLVVTVSTNIPAGTYNILGVSDDGNTIWIDPDGATILDGTDTLTATVEVFADYVAKTHHDLVLSGGLLYNYGVRLSSADYIETDLGVTEADVFTVKIHIQGDMERIDTFYTDPDKMGFAINRVIELSHAMAGFIHDDSAINV